MMSLESLREFTKRFQTIERNVAREYIQHLFLSSLYKLPESEKLLFKGGTALRLVYESPRFSEDLDFTGEYVYRHETIDHLFINALSEIEQQGITIDLREAKPTTGGYLGIIHYEFHGFTEGMKFEVSLRRDKGTGGEVTAMVNDYIPAYSIIALPGREIVRGKMAALLARQKPRDYYDLYFFLRHPTLRKFLQAELLEKVRERVLQTDVDFGELRVLLPASHQIILKNFKSTLLAEIEKF